MNWTNNCPKTSVSRHPVAAHFASPPWLILTQNWNLVTPLTPSLIISRLEHYIPTPIPTPVPTPIPTPSVAPTTPKMFHDKAENFTAIRKNLTASQKNLTASRKCFTAGHYSCLFLGKRLLASPSALVSPLVSPLVRHGFQKQPLIFKQLSARCKRCHLFFFLYAISRQSEWGFCASFCLCRS